MRAKRGHILRTHTVLAHVGVRARIAFPHLLRVKHACCRGPVLRFSGLRRSRGGEGSVTFQIHRNGGGAFFPPRKNL